MNLLCTRMLRQGTLAVIFRALGRVLVCLSPCLPLLCNVTEAFEIWERPLGWNLQYGPRYVVFWGEPSGYKEAPLGTCTYAHYATTPVHTTPPLAAFEDFQLAKIYEDVQSRVASPLMTDADLMKVDNLPFYEVSPVGRYAMLRRGDLPFGKIQNVDALLKAAKTIVLEICLDFLERSSHISSDPSATLLANLEAELARVYVVVLAVYEALSRGGHAPSDTRDAELAAIFAKALHSLRAEKTWDFNRFAYWLDASSQVTEDGGSYYVPELERTLWQCSVRALASASIAPETPFGQLYSGGANYKDCNHFVASSSLSTSSGKESLCEDSFFAVTAALETARERLLSFTSPKGKALMSEASAKLHRHLVEAAKAIRPESPFYLRASEILRNESSQ